MDDEAVAVGRRAAHNRAVWGGDVPVGRRDVPVGDAQRRARHAADAHVVLLFRDGALAVRGGVRSRHRCAPRALAQHMCFALQYKERVVDKVEAARRPPSRGPRPGRPSTRAAVTPRVLRRARPAGGSASTGLRGCATPYNRPPPPPPRISASDRGYYRGGFSLLLWPVCFRPRVVFSVFPDLPTIRSLVTTTATGVRH